MPGELESGRRTVNYQDLPEGLQGAMLRYIEERIPPGGFLRAVLSNDLLDAVCRADWLNKPSLVKIVEWVRDYAPHNCWGSPEAYERWISRREDDDPQCMTVQPEPGSTPERS